MSEWFKEHAWKACIRIKICIEGSNPSLTDEYYQCDSIKLCAK